MCGDNVDGSHTFPHDYPRRTPQRKLAGAAEAAFRWRLSTTHEPAPLLWKEARPFCPPLSTRWKKWGCAGDYGPVSHTSAAPTCYRSVIRGSYHIIHTVVYAVEYVFARVFCPSLHSTVSSCRRLSVPVRKMERCRQTVRLLCRSHRVCASTRVWPACRSRWLSTRVIHGVHNAREKACRRPDTQKRRPPRRRAA